MKKILLADDDDQILTSLQEILEINGYEVVTASNGLETKELLSVQLPDLMILDIMMPDLDGASLIVDLRSNSRTKNIPVIFVSGMVQANSNARDNVVYMAKPVKPDELIATIKSFLKE
jgi:DNA-binding response OmpR family regulator